MTVFENALHFSINDLTENRQGRLSASQQARLALERRFVRGCRLIGGALILSLFLLFISRFNPLVTTLIVVSSIGLLTTIQRWMKRPTPLTGKVISTTGILSKHIDRNEETYWYYVTVQGKEFNVTVQAYEAFVPGERYTLYYLPELPIILSVEVE